MSTKSRRRAARRHPELGNIEDQAREAIGNSILTLVTLGAIDGSEETSEPEMPASRAES